MVRVKICGITRIEDARAVVDAGGDAIGLVFAPSPRRVSRDGASAIVASLPPFVLPVGVFVSESASEIRETARVCRLLAAQVHRPLSEQEVRAHVGLFVVQACRIGSRADADAATRASGDAILLDARVEGLAGGTGRAFDWTLLAGVRFSRAVVLAGGLTPKNVAAAIRAVRPAAVDVSSGVEASPGVKDAEAVREFVRRAKAEA